MSWRMIGKPFETADMSGTPTITQKIKLPSNYLVKSVICGVVYYNAPVFGVIRARIYSDNNGSVGILIATSDSITKAQVSSLDHAYKQIGFQFSSSPMLIGGLNYHVVLNATAYTGTDASHLAWRSAYPDPQYTTNVTLEAAQADNHPFECIVMGEEIT